MHPSPPRPARGIQEDPPASLLRLTLRHRQAQPRPRSERLERKRRNQRHDTVSQRAKLIGASDRPASLHPSGHLISQQTKAGFNRRGEVGALSEDGRPSGSVRWTWRERKPFTGAEPGESSFQSFARGVPQSTA